MDLEEIKARDLIKQMQQSNVQPNNESIGTQPVCPHCGLIHPPINPGQECPNAPIQIGEEKFDTTTFFVDLKNISISQIEKKGIKDVEKMFKSLIIEITKFLENYEENETVDVAK